MQNVLITGGAGFIGSTIASIHLHTPEFNKQLFR